MKILLAGASGAIGRPILQRLIETDHQVTAIHRAPSGAEPLRDAGATPLQIDVLDRSALLTALDGQQYDAVISEITALKKMPSRHSDMAMTNRLRIDGTANLLVAAEQTGAARFVNQSMVFGYGYGDFRGRVLTEDDQFAPAGHGGFEDHLAAMRSAEEQVLRSDQVAGIALRYGLFYGPGPAGDTMVDSLRRRRLPVIRHGGVQPWVYVDDAADATVAALDRGVAGAAYNIADDEPVSLSELMITIAAAIDAPRPMIIPSWVLTAMPYAKAVMTGGLRVSNAQARDELGWAPEHPTYRDGVAALAERYRRQAAA